MSFWEVFLLFTTLIGFAATGICIYLLRQMDFQRVRMEEYLIDIGQVMSAFYLKIDSLFSQSIHYYDETIYQFIESIKEVKKEIDSTLDEYEDLREYIVPVQTPEEKAKDEPKDVLGIVRPLLPRRK